MLHKDLKLLFFRNCILPQALLLGLLLIFMFSLAMAPGQQASPQESATIFWLSSIFYVILIYNQLYQLEQDNNSRMLLIMALFPVQGVWLGKGLTGLCFLLLAQALFLGSTVIFLNQSISDNFLPILAGLVMADIGICALASLMGAAGQGTASANSLISLALFPLLIPLLLGGINIFAACFGAPGIALESWFGILGSFDAVFISASLLLFGYLFCGEG